MNWKKVLKDKTKQPAKGEYNEWKEQIAEECYYQCVYCSIHENPWGGIDHYHIDHYRPKSRAEFEHLRNDILNLFYACPVCNRFKGDDWPEDCQDSFDNIAYPDPSIVDYSDLMELELATFTLVGKYKSSKYIIERLYLNRPQLIYERREEILTKRSKKLIYDIQSLVLQVEDHDLYRQFMMATVRIVKLLEERKNIRPYKLAEIRRP